MQSTATGRSASGRSLWPEPCLHSSEELGTPRFRDRGEGFCNDDWVTRLLEPKLYRQGPPAASVTQRIHSQNSRAQVVPQSACSGRSRVLRRLAGQRETDTTTNHDRANAAGNAASMNRARKHSARRYG